MLRKLALYSLLGAGTLAFASCAKKDANVEADYNMKKASAETLVTQINTSMATMKTDHAQWQTTLVQAGTKPGADTAKINTYKQDLQKHDSDAQQIMALVDSVKMYSTATPDQGDAFKNADDRLGTNFNDLNDKWKSYEDNDATLQKNIQQFAVNTAGNAVKDTMKTSAATTSTPKTSTSTAKPAANGPHATVNHTPGGVQRNPASSNSTPAAPSSTALPSGPHTPANHTPGGVAKNPAH